MAGNDAQVKRLVKKIAALEKKLTTLQKKHQSTKAEVAELKKCCKKVEKWIKLEVKWTNQVTEMLRAVDWDALTIAYPAPPAGNPPQTPSDWPLPD